jgi:hypothetical protein
MAARTKSILIHVFGTELGRVLPAKIKGGAEDHGTQRREPSPRYAASRPDSRSEL